MKINVKLMNTDDKVYLPVRKHPGDAGADLRARIDEEFILRPRENVLIPTGVAVEIPEGFVGDVRPRSGAASVADPRLGCKPRSGTMGVQNWDEPGKTVIGSGDIHAGAAAVADPRIPKDNETLDPPPIIIALDGTRHRPLTTWELAALQGFPLWLNGKPLVLAGNSDARWREAIGNAVPVPAARAMAQVTLRALLLAASDSWELGTEAIWVASKVGWEEIRAMM